MTKLPSGVLMQNLSSAPRGSITSALKQSLLNSYVTFGFIACWCALLKRLQVSFSCHSCDDVGDGLGDGVLHSLVYHLLEAYGPVQKRAVWESENVSPTLQFEN